MTHSIYKEITPNATHLCPHVWGSCGWHIELWIKDLKHACFAQRLSCHRFWANQFRLFLHAAAYWLLDTVRWWLHQRGIAPQQLDTLRLRLLKIGGRLRLGGDRVLLRLAASHPGRFLWAVLAARPPLPLLHVHA
jgi:hypothetical protein